MSKTVKLKDIADINMGQSPKSIYYTDDSSHMPFLQGNRTFGYKYPFIDTYVTKPIKTASKGSVIMSVRAPVGDLNIATTEICIGRGVAELKSKNDENDYLYYVLLANQHRLTRSGNGSIFNSIGLRELSNMKLIVPSTENKENFIKSLKTLDEKLENNTNLIASIKEYLQLLFHKWFVDFNFPNDEDKPYQDSGGEISLINNQLLPKGWSHIKLGDLTNISTGKKDANHATEDGLYPFYTCSSEQLSSPTYSFDTKAMILAGNGEFWFNRYEGKFEAYQRNYIIEAKSDKMFDYLYLNLDKYLNIITSKSAGSIIKYLTMGMITELDVIIPDNKTLEKFNKIANTFFKKIDLLNKENIYLEEMRTLLIYKLIK